MSAQSTARQIGQAFADAVRGEPSTRRLWVSVKRDVVSLWLLTDPVDLETERRFYPLIDAVTSVASGTFVRLHVLNPRHGDPAEICSIVPADRVEITLAAAHV